MCSLCFRIYYFYNPIWELIAGIIQNWFIWPFHYRRPVLLWMSPPFILYSMNGTFCIDHYSLLISEHVCIVVWMEIKQTNKKTISNCQRPVFSLGASQHMHNITSLWKFELNWSSKLRDTLWKKKPHCHTKLCAFRCLILYFYW